MSKYIKLKIPDDTEALSITFVEQHELEINISHKMYDEKDIDKMEVKDE